MSINLLDDGILMMKKIMIDSIITKLVVGCRTLHTDIDSEP